jgi:hypothetical protein
MARRFTGVLIALSIACVLVVNTHAAQQEPPDGVSPSCTDHLTAANAIMTVLFPIIGLGGLVTDFFADEGWVWVEPNGRRTRDVSGEVVSLGPRCRSRRPTSTSTAAAASWSSSWNAA